MRLPLLLFFGSTLLSAADIRGRVLDPAQSAIADAWLTLRAAGGGEVRKARTGAGGEFLFSDVGKGRYLLDAAAPGFAATAQTVEVDSEPTRDIEFVLNIESLPQRVVVTASSTPLSVDSVAKAVDALTAEDLRARNEYSIFEALRALPGMRVQQLGGPGSFTQVFTRGLRASDTAVLLDGFRLRDAAAPQGDATSLMSDLLVVDPSGVEVLRGSGSSLYGSHAIGGVINILSETGGGPPHGEVSAEGGQLGFFRGLARAGGSAWRNRLQLSGGVTHMNVTEGVDGDDRARNTSVQSYSTLRLAPRTRVNGRVLFIDSFAQLNVNPYVPFDVQLPPAGWIEPVPSVNFVVSPNDPDARRTFRQAATLAALVHEFRPETSVRLGFQNLITSRDNRDGPGGASFQPLANNSSLFDGRIDVLQARVDSSIARTHLFTAGYEFERERFENVAREAGVELSTTSVVQRAHALYAQDQMRFLSSRLLVSLSGRWQGFSLDAPVFRGGAAAYENPETKSPPSAFTGDAAIAYLVGRGTKLRLHAGNAYRAPSLYERFGSYFYGEAFFALGDPRLSPERSLAFDGGIDQHFGSRTRLSLTYFYTRLNETIAYGSLLGQDPFGRFSGYLNRPGGLARGVEASGEVAPWRGGTLVATYTHTRAQQRTSLFPDGRLRSPRIPRNMGSFLLRQRVGRRFDVTADLYAAGDAVTPLYANGTRGYLFPGARKLDVAATYSVPVSDRVSTQFYLRVENALNRTWYEDGFRVPKAWATGGLRLMF